ncbi:hypothetical protein T459_08280 [Capsicum annuum]|uniref:Uncharacterized protein n=1 Tax=Capsicum annuum TaxID=4072 RepID=A0A2G2ZW13_CAPAN|nr:hypothetical protein FXO37_33009 [Capsicum annuum]PHT86174.1 hypothetical protein T459_08280 [Capsicum annuum]
MIDERGCWKDQLLPKEVSPNRENEIPTQNRTDDWSVAQGKSSARLLKERPSQLYFHLEGIIMDPLSSDHNPLSVTLAEPVGVRTKSFKFYNYLLDHPEFQQTIADHWRKPVAGVEDKVRTARTELITIHYEMRDATKFTELISAEIEAKKQLKKWILVEESIVRQKSRVSWLRLGDDNTKYFHSCLRSRQSQNQIRRLISLEGHTILTEQEIENEVVHFYKELLGTSAQQLLMVNVDVMAHGPSLDRAE